MAIKCWVLMGVWKGCLFLAGWAWIWIVNSDHFVSSSGIPQEGHSGLMLKHQFNRIGVDRSFTLHAAALLITHTRGGSVEMASPGDTVEDALQQVAWRLARYSIESADFSKLEL